MAVLSRKFGCFPSPACGRRCRQADEGNAWNGVSSLPSPQPSPASGERGKISALRDVRIAAAHDIGDALRREPEILEQLRTGRRFAEAIDADHATFAAHVFPPERARAGFDRDLRHAATAARFAVVGASGDRTSLVDGIDTTRTPMPSAASCFCTASARPTSEPVAITIARASRRPVRTRRSRRARSQRCCASSRGTNGRFCRDSISAVGPSCVRARASTRPRSRPCRTDARHRDSESGAGSTRARRPDASVRLRRGRSSRA